MTKGYFKFYFSKNSFVPDFINRAHYYTRLYSLTEFTSISGMQCSIAVVGGATWVRLHHPIRKPLDG